LETPNFGVERHAFCGALSSLVGRHLREQMNLDYLGDALDHWKGSLFEYLQGESLLRDFAVDPMATDREPWNEADFSLFARLLRIGRHQVIPHEVSLLARARYFAEIVHCGDVFLDPDTGIATSSSSQAAKYVRPKELATLLAFSRGRVVAVYQHIRAQKACVRVDRCLAAIAKEIDAAGWCSYESPTVVMLFLCDADTRTREIARALKDLLGRHAERRVRSGTKRGAD
jgi:hypothetical protein